MCNAVSIKHWLKYLALDSYLSSEEGKRVFFIFKASVAHDSKGCIFRTML